MDEKYLALAESSFLNERVSLSMAYVDITGDLVAGIMLSQIMYWFTPDKNGKTKLRVKKDGEFWIAKTRQEWCDELRISRRQCARALKTLDDLQIIKKEKYRFNGSPTTHICVNWEIYNRLVEDWKRNQAELYESLECDGDAVKFTFCTKRANPNAQNVQMEMTKTGKTLTDTTTETTYTDITCHEEKREKENNIVICEDDPIIKPITPITGSDNYRDCRVSFSNENGDDIDNSHDEYISEYYVIYKQDNSNAIDLDIVHRQIRNSLFELGNDDNNNYYYNMLTEIFDYYYYAYKEATGYEHTNMKSDSVTRIIQTMFDSQDESFLDVESYKQYICDYLHSDFRGNEYGACDYSMPHFVKTLYYRMLNCERKQYDTFTLEDDYGRVPFE